MLKNTEYAVMLGRCEAPEDQRTRVRHHVKNQGICPNLKMDGICLVTAPDPLARLGEGGNGGIEFITTMGDIQHCVEHLGDIDVLLFVEMWDNKEEIEKTCRFLHTVFKAPIPVVGLLDAIPDEKKTYKLETVCVIEKIAA